MTEPRPAWHTLSRAQTLRDLGVTRDGLDDTEAARRLREHGPNELSAVTPTSAWTVLIGQFRSALVLILLIATAISAALGHAVESAAIAIIVCFSIALGFVQEYRAEKALALLRQMTGPTARALRSGLERQLPARELVPGDVIVIAAGDRVPADARLLDVSSLTVDEAVLTGESLPVSKVVDALDEPSTVVAERTNLLFAGTTVTYGRGLAVIVATGMATEFGRISDMLANVEETKTPLQTNLDRLSRVLALAALAIVVVVVILGLSRGSAVMDMLLFGIALAVAVVPEALPAVVTISLALGIQRMAKRNALMRHLPAVETLGSTSVICSDKTGTLTKDQMTVRQIWVDDHVVHVSGTGYAPDGSFQIDGEDAAPSATLMTLLEAAALANDAELIEDDARWHIKGDPSEAALLTVAAKAGIERAALERLRPRIDERPFSSERKRMTTLHELGSQVIAYSKGAPEVVLATCNRQLLDGETHALDDAGRARLAAAATRMAEQALRVLAIAYKPDAAIGDAEVNMIFLGLVGLIDPPREEAADAIRVCIAAGVKPIMITGDHPETGAAIARELGLLTSGRVVTGAELQAMSDTELARRVETIEVYARVSPEQKIRVVDAWQQHGAVVAMTGDGINDAPALKKADVGIAMGLTGTDVSREAADMTLMDDNFASIVSAMAEGRRIFNNIKKYLMYLLSANIGEIGLMAGATVAGLPLPLTAVQILYINLATDGLPALALAVDPADAALMRAPPRNAQRSIFTAPVVSLMLIGGIWSMIINIALFVTVLGAGRPVEEAMAMTFVSLVLIELLKVYNFRSDRESVVKAPFANHWINLAIVWELALLLVIVYLPVLHEPFGTFALRVTDWALILALTATIIPVLELAKLLVRHRLLGTLD